MTLVAAILSLLLLLLLVALIASAVWTARGAAKRAACTRNLEKLVNALQAYAEAHGGLPPPTYEIEGVDDEGIHRTTWKELIEIEVSDPRGFTCPADETICEAEESRPAESRATTFPSSYEYVYQRHSRVVVAGPPRAAASDERGPLARPQTESPAPVLVCSHHDTPGGRRASWCLVAYEDGSISWERIAASRRQEAFDSPPGMRERSDESATDAVPLDTGPPRGPSSVGRSGRADGVARRSDSTTAAPARASRDRRPR